MQDQKRWRDRYQLSLDNRHVFLLFFSSAVVVGLVFALGVLVGKRLAPPAPKPQAADPLALLDQLGSQENPDDRLSFPEALGEGKGAAGNKGRRPKGVSEEAGEKKAPAPVAAAASEEREPERETVRKAKKGETDPAEKPVAKGKTAEVASRREGRLKGAPAAKGKTAAPEELQAASKSGDGHYTLQLSSFQERGEADQFSQKLRKAGLSPQIIPARIPGRGVWYRVRLGNFSSWDAAMTAKQTFEKTQNHIAYVTRHAM
ncbi:MAG: SPOR domain-containing protein [Deltaproteobacteria bacterium]|nr:SPOR domain-containing protein [Deltaproteobacteria bacterium]